MGQHAADWLEGKSIPQAMDILPKALTLQNLAEYEADTADPASVYRDGKRRDEYLKMYGNICYDMRDQDSISPGRLNAIGIAVDV